MTRPACPVTQMANTIFGRSLSDGLALNAHTYFNRTPDERRKIRLQVHSHPILRKE